MIILIALTWTSTGDMSTELRHISSRTTPPFGPMQFENTFFHLHIGEQEFNPTTDLQTEFTALEWMRPSEMIERLETS